MKRKVLILLDEELFNKLKEKHINKSGLINKLIKDYLNSN